MNAVESREIAKKVRDQMRVVEHKPRKIDGEVFDVGKDADGNEGRYEEYPYSFGAGVQTYARNGAAAVVEP